MCGLAGWIVPGNGAPEVQVLAEMTNTLAHRGPDDVGVYTATTAQGEYQVGLGHRRLAIIDLAGGHQPMHDDSAGLSIVYNGEVYNFRELRAELAAAGYRFERDSDTEVILRAYQHWGVDAVRRLRGMFAFALWDSQRERLLLARDRFGKKPLFLAEHRGGLVFASEAKALFKFPGVTPRVAPEAVWEYLSYRYVPGPLTLFQGVRKLMPGTVVIWHRGQIGEQRYYSPPDREACVPGPAPADPVKRFLEVLDESVRIRMVSDVPFGAFLSGGIDSSAIVALMSRHATQPVKTFAVGFRESAYSELDYARTMAQALGTDHHELTVSPARLVNELPQLVSMRGAPLSEPSDIPIYLLAKEAGKTVKMVLTGEGSDEILGGYPKHVYERYAGLYARLPQAAKAQCIEPLVRSLPYRFRRIKTGVLTLGLADYRERMVHWFGALNRRERDAIGARCIRQASAYSGIQFDSPIANSSLRRILYFDQTSWLPDNLLERGDSMMMAASIEGRMPFMDHELAAYVSSLPDSWRVNGRRTKHILRQAMVGVLPEKILRRRKVGFRVPVNEWFRNGMREFLMDHLTGPSALTRCYYQGPRLDQLLNEHLQGRQNHEKILWAMLNLEIWHRQYRPRQ